MRYAAVDSWIVARRDLIHWVREQAVSITRHRNGRLTAIRPLPPVV